MYLLTQAPSEETAAEIRFSVDEIKPLQRGFHVAISAHNMGTATLADLHVSARVLSGEQELERADLTIDYLPGRSMRKGGLYLDNDPRAHRLEVRAEGYQAP